MNDRPLYQFSEPGRRLVYEWEGKVEALHTEITRLQRRLGEQDVTIDKYHQEVERLTAERDKWIATWKEAVESGAAVSARLDKALEALAPFEELADEGNEDQPDDTKVVVHAGRSTCYWLTLADLRRVRSALSPQNPTEEKA